MLYKNLKKGHIQLEKRLKLHEAIATSIHSTSKKYDIDRTSIRKWIKNIES